MYLILIAAATGQGKSTFLNKHYLKNKIIPNPENRDKNLYLISQQSTRQYIFDVNAEYILPPDDRLLPRMRHIDGDILTFIDKCKKLSGYNIVIEDATGFLRGKQNNNFARLLTSKIHKKNNYIVLFHSLNRIPPELMEMANFLVLFKTVDNFELIDRKFKNQKINLAFKDLQRLPDKTTKTIKLI